MSQTNLLYGLLIAGLFGCFGDDFVVSDAGQDGGQRDSSLDLGRRDAGEDEGVDGGVDVGVDQGPPLMAGRVDSLCDMPWSQLGEEIPAVCVGRRFHTILIDDPFVSGETDVALTDDGRIAIAYQQLFSIDEGGIELLRLDPTSLATTDTATISASFGTVAGESLALVGVRDTVHLAYWLRSGTGSVVYQRWFGDGVLGAEEVISGDVSEFGSVDVAPAESGVTFVYHDLLLGEHRVRLRDNLGVLTAPVTMLTEDPSEPNASHSIAAVRRNRTTHIAYRNQQFAERARPIYRRFAGSLESTNTLDNESSERASGLSIDIANSDIETAVAYFDWQAGTAELRVARFSADNNVSITVLESFSSAEPPVGGRISMAYDDARRLNILAYEPGTTPRLVYYREPTLDADGAVEWLDDTVAIGEEIRNLSGMDLTMGPMRRPHIVYGRIDRLLYATVDP